MKFDAVGRQRGGAGFGGGHDEREQTPQPDPHRNGWVRERHERDCDGGNQPSRCAR